MQQTNKHKANAFKTAIESCETAVANGYCVGLKALGKSSKCVVASDTSQCTGSVDLDTCLSGQYPNDNRWDYVVGYCDEAYFVEIHPASTSEVGLMLKKRAWLTKWIDKHPRIKDIAAGNCYYWIPSGRVDILPGTSQSRQLAQSNIKIVKHLHLPA